MTQFELLRKVPTPARVPILYLILGVLISVSVVPMCFYSHQITASNRDRLKTNEMLLQNTITRSLADNISQHETTVRLMLANLSSAIQVASGGDLSDTHVTAPELRALLENFVSSSDELAYATLLNPQAKGISAGRIAPDAFLHRGLGRAVAAGRGGGPHNGEALALVGGEKQRTIMLL